MSIYLKYFESLMNEGDNTEEIKTNSENTNSKNTETSDKIETSISDININDDVNKDEIIEVNPGINTQNGVNNKNLKGGYKKKIKGSDEESKNKISETLGERTTQIINKIEDFKKKCFYAKFDEREFNFIQDIDSSKYHMYSFIKDPINKTQDKRIGINDKGLPILVSDYEEEKEKIFKEEALAEYNHLLNSEHNKLVYNDSKSNISYSNQNYMKSINYYLSHPSKSHLTNLEDLVMNFIDIAANLRRHSIGFKYFSDNNDNNALNEDSFKKYNLKEQIKIFKLPREVIDVINHISYYFSKIKNDLKFNEITGYYEMNVQGENVPIMCRHIYMTLNGDNLYTISNECAVKNCCKYCGDTLDSIGFEDTTTLPRTVAEYAYLLMSAYGCSTDDQSTFIYIYNGMASLIAKLVKREDPEFDNKASGVAALLCWNVIHTYPPKSKTSSFIMMISETLASVGFNEQKVQNIINTGILGDPKDIYTILIATHDSSLYDMESVFKDYSKDDIIKVKKEGQMELFNLLYKQLRIDNLKIDEIVKNFKTKSVEMKKDDIEPTRYNTLMIFEDYAKKYCIATNKIHKFEKGVCIHCGMQENYKNIEEIYDKFNDKFNSTYNLDIENKFNIPKVEKINIDSILKNNPENTKKEIMKYFNISSYEFDSLKNNLITDLPIIIPTINTWTHLNKYDWTIDEILNVIVYFNDESLYSLLSWEDDISKNVVVNGEDAENDDDDDDE